MLTSLLALQSSNFSFGGGNAEQFVRALTRQHVAPAVIFADPAYRFKPTQDVPRSLLKGKALSEAAGALSYGSTLALSAKELPSGFLVRLGYNDYEDAIPGRASVRHEKGRVIVEGRSCWVKVNDLLSLSYDHPVSCHWLYRTAYVAITPGSFQEEPLLHAVADALGADWSSTPTGYRIGFNAKNHRERALETYRSARWQMPEAEIPGRKATFLLAAESTSDEVWAKTYVTPDGSAVQGRISPQSAVAVSGMKLLEYLANNAKRTHQKYSYATIQNVLDLIDREKNIRIRAKADGILSVDFPLFDGRTWTGV